MELECVFLPISLQFSKDQGEDAFFQVACEFSSATCGSIPSPEPFFKYLPRRHSLGAVSGVGFVCGGCAAAALAPAAWRQSAPRLAGEQKRPARDSRCAQAARPGCLEAGLTLLCRYLLAEPLPLETSLPAPHLPSTYTFPSSLSVPACSLATPLGSTSPLGFPWRGWGVCMYLFFHTASRSLVPHSRMESVPPAVEAWSPNHWRQFPACIFLS